MFWCSGNDSHRYETLLCEIRLYSRFSRESCTYDCDEHARIKGQTSNSVVFQSGVSVSPNGESICTSHLYRGKKNKPALTLAMTNTFEVFSKRGSIFIVTLVLIFQVGQPNHRDVVNDNSFWKC